MSTNGETNGETDLVLEVAPPEVGHLKIKRAQYKYMYNVTINIGFSGRHHI